MTDSSTTLVYLTGNRFKFEVAQHALAGMDITLEQERLNVPELQSNSVQEIAEFSAQWARERIDRPFVVTDAGFYIDALNGFPGPFAKFINQWFGVEELLRLMHDKPYRRMTTYDCLVYARPGLPSVTFAGSYPGKLATVPSRNTGTPLERLFVPDGYELAIADFTPAERRDFWSRAAIWQQFKAFYAKQAAPDKPKPDYS